MVALDSRQVKVIKDHLALVRKIDAKHSNMFVAWLEMKLRDATTLDIDETAEVRRLLGAQFKHDIDKQCPGDANELQAIHDGEGLPSCGPGWSPGPVYRC